MLREEVIATRLATQRLTGPPASDPAQVVRELLAVQAQDAPLARAMVALRCAGTAADVAAAVARGEIVRTHVLRPTWHYVATDDLRRLLRLTSPKVEAGMASRHRLLQLEGTRLDAAIEVVASRLAGRRFAGRTELAGVLAAAGALATDDPQYWAQVTHVLLVAELRGVLCSAPVADAEHHYALADEVLPAEEEFDRDATLVDLVGRFVASHGPVALPDLVRWAKVTLTEARRALDVVGERVDRVRVDSEELWFAPSALRPATRPQRAWLLSTFDEAFLSYRRVGWTRSAGNPDGPDERRFAQSAGGPVLCDGLDVGGWKRRWDRGRAWIDLTLDPGLAAGARDAVDEAVDRLLLVITGPPSSVGGSTYAGA
ncbi:MAG: winged helix DNA-binding domain-containing protein [Propionicimonas sp.]|uniref:winged helix DNA-binding domain-containing protein n=1 Tax=Propionicimonas sp. TaxID=1955623 RepID=UPI003D0EF150